MNISQSGFLGFLLVHGGGGVSLVSSFLFTRPTRFIPQETMTIQAESPSTASNKPKLYPFQEARKIARGHGFSSKEEFIEYTCPGAYQLPKNPEEVWASDWNGWEDFLGICHGFESGREIARKLNIQTEKEYLSLFEEKKFDDDDPASRLPYRPDLKYKDQWQGWDDWLKGSSE